VRLSEHFNVAVNMQINDIDLAAASYVFVTSRVNYNFNTRMFLNALLQYNTDLPAVELERTVQSDSPAAQRFLPGLQRTPARR
jgi:hypothetical protein